jgi:hypothetical protein
MIAVFLVGALGTLGAGAVFGVDEIVALSHGWDYWQSPRSPRG